MDEMDKKAKTSNIMQEPIRKKDQRNLEEINQGAKDNSDDEVDINIDFNACINAPEEEILKDECQDDPNSNVSTFEDSIPREESISNKPIENDNALSETENRDDGVVNEEN